MITIDKICFTIQMQGVDPFRITIRDQFDLIDQSNPGLRINLQNIAINQLLRSSSHLPIISVAIIIDIISSTVTSSQSDSAAKHHDYSQYLP